MANGVPKVSGTTNNHVFAMDPEPTLRSLARHLIASQTDMAELVREAQILRTFGANYADVDELLADFELFQKRWLAERLPSLTAAMKLALEVYDTFGPGMTRIDDPIEAGIWNNKYFVWERELSVATIDLDGSDWGSRMQPTVVAG
jgi:hypothetical protein